MRVDPFYITNLSTALNQAQLTQQNDTSELSSGIRVNSLSDDPVAAGQNVTLLNQIQQDDAFTESATLVTGGLQVADSALGSVITQLTSAISLATQGNNQTLNASDRASVASQLKGVLGEVETLANSSYQGQYIFAGAQTTTAPFGSTDNTTPSTTTYYGDEDVSYLVSPSGQKIQLNVPGDQIFQGSGNNNVFVALNNLVADYSGTTFDEATAAKDTASLNTALNYVSQKRVTIDNSLNQLTAASEAISGMKTQLQAAQNTLLQADTASVATSLSLSEAQQSALESVISQMNSVSNSLFSKIQ